MNMQDYLQWVKIVEEKNTPQPMVAVIREDECIGCTKCITACPVDTIVGSGKLMHTVISSECTGCQLCIEPCPVDCIDMIAVKENGFQDKIKTQQRFENRKQRLASAQKHQKKRHQQNRSPEITAKQSYILQALGQVKAKRVRA